MSWRTLPEPGKAINGVELGPCSDSSCGHSSCDETRERAQARCYVCGEPIGYETRFVTTDKGPAHYGCDGNRT